MFSCCDCRWPFFPRFACFGVVGVGVVVRVLVVEQLLAACLGGRLVSPLETQNQSVYENQNQSVYVIFVVDLYETSVKLHSDRNIFG